MNNSYIALFFCFIIFFWLKIFLMQKSQKMEMTWVFLVFYATVDLQNTVINVVEERVYREEAQHFQKTPREFLHQSYFESCKQVPFVIPILHATPRPAYLPSSNHQCVLYSSESVLWFTSLSLFLVSRSSTLFLRFCI